MGERLEAVATTAAAFIDGDQLQTWSYDPRKSVEYLITEAQLANLLERSGLASIVVNDDAGIVVMALGDSLALREPDPYWELDLGDRGAALLGTPTASSLFEHHGVVQKSAFAPVETFDETIVGLVAVHAEADYLDDLSALRAGAWITAGIVLAVLLALLSGLARLLRDIVRYRASLADQEKLAAMGRMTAGIAHEIRNPLGILRGAGESLEMRLEGLGQDATMARFVMDEVDRLDAILTRYLTFGRGGGLSFVATDLESLVRSTVRDLAEAFGEKGVSSVVDVAGEPREAEADPTAVRQLLINLLLNAADAAAGSDGARVDVVLTFAADRATITIVDTGPGLGGADPESLFEPFRTTKEKGSGLGLAVARQVAVDHGGTVTLADRADGPGAAAVVTLPYRVPTTEDD